MGFTEKFRYSISVGLSRPPVYPDSAVKLSEVKLGLNLFLHALAESTDRQVVAGKGGSGSGLLARKISSRRHWDDLVWQDSETVHLPEVIQRFSNSELNRDLYYWLAAYLAFDSPIATNTKLSPGLLHLLRGVVTSRAVLNRCPGLEARYQRLCNACLHERVKQMPPLERHNGQGFALLENGIRSALGQASISTHPWLDRALSASNDGRILDDPPKQLSLVSLPFLPAALWGHPVPPSSEIQPLPEYVDPELLDESTHQAYSAECSEETVLNTDLVNDSDEEEYRGDDKYYKLKGGMLYPEWNYRKQKYRADWCRVFEEIAQERETDIPDAELQRLALRVRRQFEAIRLQDRWHRRLPDGEEVDMDEFVNAYSERRGSGYGSDRVYRRRNNTDRELAVTVLLDVSTSTQGRVEGLYRVIDIAQQAMLVLGEALGQLQDEFAMYAFSSHSRAYVDCLRLKGFSESYNDAVRQRILSLRPGGSTRMGAALRHVGWVLQRRLARNHLLLILTDGRPYDPSDKYQGHYALEDSRRALLDLHHKGIFTFGLTIDKQGLDYLPYLFGPGKYMVFSNVANLPESLPRLYARITGLGK